MTYLITGIVIYLIGYVVAYKKIKNDYIKEFEEWSVYSRKMCLFFSIGSWFVWLCELLRPKYSDHDRSAKW